MDSVQKIVIIDNKIVTDKLLFCKYDGVKNIYIVKYKDNNKIYNYSRYRVKVLVSSDVIDLKRYYFLLNDKEVKNICKVYEFNCCANYYYKVFFLDNTFIECADK